MRYSEGDRVVYLPGATMERRGVIVEAERTHGPDSRQGETWVLGVLWDRCPEVDRRTHREPDFLPVVPPTGNDLIKFRGRWRTRLQCLTSITESKEWRKARIESFRGGVLTLRCGSATMSLRGFNDPRAVLTALRSPKPTAP